MIFKEWLLNLNIWTLWLVDDSIKKKERSYFPPWTQLGNFGYPLWHIWCFKWNFMNCWIYYHEIWLRHSQNFRISISSNAYWHNITEQLECWIYNTPPLCFCFFTQNRIWMWNFKCRKCPHFFLTRVIGIGSTNPVSPLRCFMAVSNFVKGRFPPHHLKKAQQKWKTAKMTIFIYFKKGTW